MPPALPSRQLVARVVSSKTHLAIAVAVGIAVAWGDWTRPFDFAVSSLYVLPVLYLAWFVPGRMVWQYGAILVIVLIAVPLATERGVLGRADDCLIALAGVYLVWDRQRATRALECVNRQMADRIDEQLASLREINRDLGGQIAERTLVETNLRESEQRFRALVECGYDGINVLDSTGWSNYSSPRNATLVGLASGEVDDDTLRFVHPDDRPAVQDALAQLLATPDQVFDLRLRLVRKDGAEFWAEAHARNLLDHSAVRGIVVNWRDVTDRKRAEDQLRESEQRYRLIAELASSYSYQATITADHQVSYQWISGKFFEVTGYHPEELTEQGWIALIPSEDLPAVLEQVAGLRSPETDPTEALELRILTRTGEVRWIRSVVHPLPPSRPGEPMTIYGAVLDITDRKQVEQMLLKSESLFRTLAEVAPVGIYRTDPSGAVVYLNDRLCEICGFTRESVLSTGTGWATRVHPDDRASVVAGFEQAVGSRQPFSAEYRFQHPDGRVVWVISRSQPETGPYGESLGRVGTLIDITQRKQADVALREGEERLRTLLVNLDNVAVQGYEPDGRITFWNRASEHLYGYSAAEVLGRDLVHLLYGEETSVEERRIMSEALRTGELPAAEEVEAVRNDGSRVCVFASRMLHPRPGKPPEFFCFGVDITARKRAEEELAIRQAEVLHASRLSTVGQMVAALSHEVAQPLSAIGNFAAASAKLLASESTPQAAKQIEYIHAIIKQNQRCSDILQRLRDFSRRTPERRSPCDVNEMLRESADLVVGEFRRHKVRLRLELVEALPPTSLDRVQIQQVLVNLLSNARDAVRDHPRERRQITLRSRQDEDMLILEVEDRGDGLSDAAQTRLFEPFFTTKESGMGIGLSICRMIVLEHGGQIDAVSNEHGGATFRVRLPTFQKTAHER